MFDSFDTDQNGTIDLEEFKQMTVLLGLPWSSKRVKSEFGAIDADSSGGISFDEFFKWWSKNRSSTNKKVSNELAAALDGGFDKSKDFKTDAPKPKVLSLPQQREFFLNVTASSFTPSFQSLTLLQRIQDIIDEKFEKGGDVKAAINSALEDMRLDIGKRSAAHKQQMDDYLNSKTD